MQEMAEILVDCSGRKSPDFAGEITVKTVESAPVFQEKGVVFEATPDTLRM